MAGAPLSAAVQRLWLLVTAAAAAAAATQQLCVVPALGSPTADDAPAIVRAFKDCGQGGVIRFSATTYHVNSIMNVRANNAVIDVQGTLLWSTDVQYWLKHSMPVGYQNQSTAFIVGGDNVTIDGHGVGTLNGNGDVWYKFIGEQQNPSNYPGRPHALTLTGLTHSTVKGLKFIKSQMWSMSIVDCNRVTLDSIYVDNTATSGSGSNTDGANTIRSSNINFNNWTVLNADDSLALKGNSSDISITNCKFYNGLGIAIGSVGQINGEYEAIRAVTIDNIEYSQTLHALYFKTWTATPAGYPPNGGGGGEGDLYNMTATGLVVDRLRGPALSISQCTSFQGGGTPADCTNSAVQIYGISVRGLRGKTMTTKVASLQCSAVKPCHQITLQNINLEGPGAAPASDFLCAEVKDTIGFSCTGPACVGSSATGGC